MGLLSSYKAWVQGNRANLSAAEGLLSTLTWLLPDRFSDSELTVEAIHTFLGLVSLLHESISDAAGPASEQASLPWPFLLGATRQLEVLVEMGANKLQAGGRANKYTILAALEAIKAALRLAILDRSGGRILTDAGLGGNDATGASPGARGPDARLLTVFAALARFRAAHGLPCVPQYSKAAVAVGAAPGSATEAKDCKIDAAAEVKGDAAAAVALPGGGPAALLKGITPPALEMTTGPTAVAAAGAALEAGAAALSASSKEASTEYPSTASPRFWWDLPAEREAAAPAGGSAEVGARGPSEGVEGEDGGEDDVAGSPRSTERRRHLAAVDTRVTRATQLGARALAAGELLHTLRPLLYVLALRRWGRGAWWPWALSLAVDLVSAKLVAMGAGLQRTAMERAVADPRLFFGSVGLLYRLQTFRWSPVEEREIIRRRLLLLYYVIRSPVFELVTRPVVETGGAVLRPIPLLGSLYEKTYEILCGIQNYYTYTSAS